MGMPQEVDGCGDGSYTAVFSSFESEPKEILASIAMTEEELARV